jgi:hypothetical protein
MPPPVRGRGSEPGLTAGIDGNPGFALFTSFAGNVLKQVIAEQQVLQGAVADLGSRDDARDHVGEPKKFLDQRVGPLDVHVLRQRLARTKGVHHVEVVLVAFGVPPFHDDASQVPACQVPK